MSDIQHGIPPPQALFGELIGALFAAEPGTWVSMPLPTRSTAQAHGGINNAVGHRLIEITVKNGQVFVRCRVPNEWPA